MILPTIPAPSHPPAVLTPAQRAGLRYQWRVGRWLRANALSHWDLMEGPWLAGPTGPCSPDFVLTPRLAAADADHPIVLLEVKLTQCDCTLQLSRYRRALEPLGPVVAIQVCRRVLEPPTVRGPDDFTHDGHMLLWV